MWQMGLIRDVSVAWQIFRKDLKLEAKQKIEFFAIVIFSVGVVLVFSLAVAGPTGNQNVDLHILGGSMWIIFSFAGMLSYTSLFNREMVPTLSMLWSFPVKPQSIFLGKLIFNLSILFSVETIIIGLYVVFFNLSFNQTIPIIIICLFLTTLDYSIVGTLVASLVIYSRARTMV